MQLRALALLGALLPAAASAQELRPPTGLPASGSWATYVPSVAVLSGGSTAPTWSNIGARYVQIGKRVEAQVTATVNSPGNGNGGGILVSLPIAARTPQPGVLIGGREDGVTGLGLSGKLYNATSILVQTSAGNYPAGSAGQQINVGFSYEVP